MLSFPAAVRGVSALAIASCLAVPALAGDFGGYGLKDEPGAPMWRGLYFGLNAGGIADGTATYDFLPSAPGSKAPVDLKGPLGGVQAGYNVQRGPIVAGIEADADLLKTDGHAYDIYAGGTLSTQINEAYSVRGRLGVTLAQRVLFYGTGGYALATVDHTLDFGGQLFKDSGLIGGWVAGGGLEYMHSSRLSFGVEVLHYDFGQDHFNLSNNYGGFVNTLPADIDTAMTTVRGRISFHLD